jgi:hypothetical protein
MSLYVSGLYVIVLSSELKDIQIRYTLVNIMYNERKSAFR